MNVYHYNLGLGYALLNPETRNWTLDANVGAGGLTINLDVFTVIGFRLSLVSRAEKSKRLRESRR